MKLHHLLISGIIYLSSCSSAYHEEQNNASQSDDPMVLDSVATEVPTDGDVPRAEPVPGENESFPDPESNDTTLKN